MHRLASLCAAVLLIGCGSLPKGLSPKPDIRPVQQSQAKVQASVGKTREHITHLKESSSKSASAVRQAVADLERYTGTDQAVKDAQAQLKIAEDQQKLSDQYIGWADGELAIAWDYGVQAGKQIETLSGQIDTAHENERVAVAAVEKWKPIIDQVNAYWGLGAFAYGFKRLASHLFILVLVLGVLGTVVFFVFPAVIPIALGAFRRISSVVGSLFRKR